MIEEVNSVLSLQETRTYVICPQIGKLGAGTSAYILQANKYLRDPIRWYLGVGEYKIYGNICRQPCRNEDVRTFLLLLCQNTSF